MRDITQKASEAFKNGTPFKYSNTKVMGDKNHTILTLHDNVIATKAGNKLLLTDSGWQTNTTKERLNGILDAYHSEWRIYQLGKEDNKPKWYITDGMGQRKDWNGVMEIEV